MNDPINVLIVEDEPLITNSLKLAFKQLSKSNSSLDFTLNFAKNCDSALLKIDSAVNSTPFDLVLLDINIPASSDRQLLSGEDLGLELKGLFPKVKIIVFTSHNSNFRLNNILKSLNPDGFLIKSDIDFKRLIKAIEAVIFEPPYYSKVILQLLRHHATNDFTLDKIDRQLLYLLSRGAKTKDILSIIFMSKGGIERRKRNLKEIFDIKNENDQMLIKLAEENGYI